MDQNKKNKNNYMHNIIKAKQINQIVIIGRSYLNCFNQ